MNRRQKKSLIFGLVAIFSSLLILTTFWALRKEYQFVGYKNTLEGFSMVYPARWAYRENVGGAAVIFFSPKETKLDWFQESVNIVIQDLSENPKTLEEYTNKAIRQMEVVFEENLIVKESVDTYFAGQPGHKFVYIGKGPDSEFKNMHIWTIHGLKAYQFNYTAVSSEFDKYKDKVEKMLKSFKIEQ